MLSYVNACVMLNEDKNDKRIRVEPPKEADAFEYKAVSDIQTWLLHAVID